MIRWHVFHSRSIIFRNWEYTYYGLANIPEKQLYSHSLYSDLTTGQKSWWNEGPYVQLICVIIRVGIYKNRPMWGGSNQIYMIRNATKSAVFAATDSGPGKGNLNLHEAICAHHWMSETKAKKKVSEEKKKKGLRFTWIYACWVSTTVMLTSEVCQKRKRLPGFLMSLNISALCW